MTRSIHSGNTGVLGHRVGAGGRPGEPERALADSEPRVEISFWCASLHETRCIFAATVKVPPATWPCSKCGQPAGLDKGAPPPPERFRAMRSGQEQSHMEFVRKRGRSKEDGEALIQWALDRLHERRLRDQAASQDVEIFGPVASAILPASLVGGLVASGAITVRRQPRRRSRAQRKGQVGVVAGHYVLCAAGSPQDASARL
jgi:hypothetical protein